MENQNEGKKAIDELNGATLENRALKVNESKPKNRY
jgi:RNA recognition motif-containing protein